MNIVELYEIYRQYPSIQTDTRKLKKGDIFFALRGPNFNANAFAVNALDSGAAYAVIDDSDYNTHANMILVNDALDTLQQLALYHRNQFNIPFLAITGSNGKTTTKELIHTVLSTSFKTYTTEGNLNNHIGVPLTILKIRSDAEMAVIEMGANHRGEIASYCQYARPTHGLITNVGKAHLEGFGGYEGVKKGKGELYDFIRGADGTAFVMWDYDYLREMSAGIRHIVKYGSFNAKILESEPFLAIETNNTRINTQLVGAYNFPNVVAAAAIGSYFNIPMEKI
jgi:UDP-N-acetylmuramoyl-tripeptide--D-alanyl-D-alanine ligase